MNLHIDGIIFSLQRHGGITVYFRELLSHLELSGIQTTLTIDSPTLQPAPFLSEDVRVVSYPSRILERYRDARGSPEGAIFHSSYYRLPTNRSQPSVVTVHDFTYERFIQGPALWVHRRQKYAAVRAAQAIICISEATKDDLMEFVGVRSDQSVHVIPNGVSDIFRPLSHIKYNPGDLLFVGDRRGYKNFRLLLESLVHLSDLRVLCVGGGDLRDEEFKGLPLSVKERVSHLGYVTDEKLNEHYNRAAALVYPSAYEGFGIPVVEAMRAGCPVVCIESKAVVEVGGDALCVSAHESDPVALAQAVLRLDDDKERQRLRALGLARSQQFSWDQCFSETLAVYRSI